MPFARRRRGSRGRALKPPRRGSRDVRAARLDEHGGIQLEISSARACGSGPLQSQGDRQTNSGVQLSPGLLIVRRTFSRSFTMRARTSS